MNHVFFKPLLFLSAGSVIHAMMDELDMRKMGGLPPPKDSLVLDSTTDLNFPLSVAKTFFSFALVPSDGKSRRSLLSLLMKKGSCSASSKKRVPDHKL